MATNRSITLFTMALSLLLIISAAVTDAQTTEELKRMTLREVLDIQVSTVSRVPEETTSVPAAVFVITQEDIKRSGATSIPEALRLAPGVQVARINGGTWAIGIRGFADRLARSVLVLIDGRAVYSPLFAGTYWESQDVLLEDIDHIEVIRGPGGTLWGANAVNGIINIITKAAKQTQGAYASAGGGSEDRGFGSFRYGGTSNTVSYRAYVKALDRGPEFASDGNSYDGWHSVQGGFRADWTLASAREFTLQGDAYDGRLGERPTVTSYTSPFVQTTNVDAPISGANVIARLSGRDFRLQAYYDHTDRDELPIGEARDTVDVDFQDTLRRWSRSLVTWGAEYRVTSGRITAAGASSIAPARRTDNLFTTFVQDDVALQPERWRLTIGSKFEHNDYSGFEMQPSIRLLWTPDVASSVWAAITRAVRTPSRVETDYTTASLNGLAPIPTFVRLEPNPDFDSEKLVAYELGYKLHPTARLYVTASGFYNDLQDTLSTDLLTPFVETTPLPVRLILPVMFRNGLHGSSRGFELTSDTRPVPWMRVTANYSFLTVSMTKNPGSTDVSQERHYEDAIPHHQVQVGASFDVSRWSFDWNWRYISSITAGSVPAYGASDIRVAWHPDPRVELSVVGQDLFSAHHVEWPSPGANIAIERSIYARVSWRR